MDFLWPRGRIVAPFILVGLACHGRDDEAALGICLVLALGVQVEEHRRVSIKDRLNADALLLVLFVLFILVHGAQTPCTKAASHTFLEGVVISFFSTAVLLVSTVQAVTCVSQFVVLLAFLAHKVDGDAVVAVLVDDADDGQVDLVDLELGLVLELLAQRTFPLSTCN